MKKIKIFKLKSYTKKSGKLVPINFNREFPIKVKRIFYIFGKKNHYRGDHAHKKCKQLFIPVSGSVSLIMKTNDKEEIVTLDSKNDKAILVPNLVWCRLKFLTKNSIVLVACDRKYEFKDYIDNYTNFKKIEKNK
jgi:UDP-2-acetamido-3-amino-2,3-dideoxy-glucuronate N-acetyltransferase